MLVSKSKAAEMVAKYDSSLMFTVKFVKRTTGEVRVMNCRKGVKKFTNGGTLAYSPKEKNLVCVWDAKVEDPAKAYRMIPLENIIEIKMEGETYEVS